MLSLYDAFLFRFLFYFQSTVGIRIPDNSLYGNEQVNPDNQHGFRAESMGESSKRMDTKLWEKMVTGVLLWDLSAAFDWTCDTTMSPIIKGHFVVI